MANLFLEIFRFPSDRQLPAIAYYVLLDHRAESAVLTSETEATTESGYRQPLSSTDFRTAVAQATPQAAINETRRKLEQCLETGDTVEYDGTSYSRVLDVVQAIVQTRDKWQ